jgi:Photosynthetic reaction centre cytochrome C subunit
MTRHALALLLIVAFAAARASAQDDFEKRVAGKTAADVNKNIQVLKTLPAIDLFPVMQFMAASLGVGCDYCHVTDNTGRWPMEKDDKPQKLAARRMLTMVQQINQTHFNGQNRITCASCHHGGNRPTPYPPVVDAQHADRFTAVAQLDPKEQETLPTVRAVLDRFVTAIGGREANAKITSRRWKGTMTPMATGRSLRFDVIEAAPDKMRVTVTGDQGTTLQGVDGADTWTVDPQGGVHGEIGFEAARMRRLADFHRNEQLDVLDPTLAVIGVQTTDGRRAVVLQGALPNTQIERLYFDRESGLLARRLTLSPTPFGLLPEQTDFEDYRTVGAVKLPFLIRRSTPSFSNTQRYDDIALDAPIDAALFKRPVPR